MAACTIIGQSNDNSNFKTSSIIWNYQKPIYIKFTTPSVVGEQAVKVALSISSVSFGSKGYFHTYGTLSDLSGNDLGGVAKVISSLPDEDGNIPDSNTAEYNFYVQLQGNTEYLFYAYISNTYTDAQCSLKGTKNHSFAVDGDYYPCIYIDNGTSFEAYQCYIDNGTSWDLYVPYIDNGTGWDMCG